MNKENFLSVVNRMKLKNQIFFPFPIYLSINKKYKSICKKNKIVQLIFNKNNVCNFHIKSTFTFNKEEKKIIGKKLFKTNSKKHPGYLYFKKENEIFLSGKILNFNKRVIKNINFSSPIEIKKKIGKLKMIAGFHTRNIPHKGHEWIHSLGAKKCKNILIQPIVGHFKLGEYSEQALINANKYIVRKQNLFNKKQKIPHKYFFSFINIFPKYAGPREALFHALIRKNYGCTHFLIGRDHAGYKNFYNEYASQKLCIKYEKKLQIKIIKYNSPKICKYCKKITNKKCICKNSKNKNSLLDINGTKIRKLINKKQKLPEYLIDKKIFQKLKVKNILYK